MFRKVNSPNANAWSSADTTYQWVISSALSCSSTPARGRSARLTSGAYQFADSLAVSDVVTVGTGAVTYNVNSTPVSHRGSARRRKCLPSLSTRSSTGRGLSRPFIRNLRDLRRNAWRLRTVRDRRLRRRLRAEGWHVGACRARRHPRYLRVPRVPVRGHQVLATRLTGGTTPLSTQACHRRTPPSRRWRAPLTAR